MEGKKLIEIIERIRDNPTISLVIQLIALVGILALVFVMWKYGHALSTHPCELCKEMGNYCFPPNRI